MLSGRNRNCLIFSIHCIKQDLCMMITITPIRLPILDKCHYQLTNQSTLKIGDHSMAFQILMDAYGNSRSVQCFRNHQQYPNLLPIKRVIVGIFAIYHSRSSWCAMRDHQSRSMNVIFSMKVSTTIHASINLKASVKTVVQICLSQCLKHTRWDWCQVLTSQLVTPDCNKCQIHMVDLRIEQCFITEWHRRKRKSL